MGQWTCGKMQDLYTINDTRRYEFVGSTFVLLQPYGYENLLYQRTSHLLFVFQSSTAE